MKFRSLLLLSAAVVATGALVAQAQVPGVNSTLNSVFTLAYDNSTMKPTYSASAAFSPTGTTPTDVCILNGSATKLVKVRRVIVAMNATTAVSIPVAVVKRSTANAGGTPVAITQASYDSSNPAVTAVAQYYTGNATLGTTAGVLDDSYFNIGNLTTGGALPVVREYGRLGQPIVLRGVAQGVAVNLGANSESGIVASCTFEWTEE